MRTNLAVHGLEGEIKHGGNIYSYYDDPRDATGRFLFGLPRLLLGQITQLVCPTE